MAQAAGETEGIVKVIIHAKTDQGLEAHIMGPHRADLIVDIALGIRAGLSAPTIIESIHTCPTLSEAMIETVRALYGQAVHIPTMGAVR